MPYALRNIKGYSMRYLIIGGSAAGVSAAETLRRHDKKADITVVSDESFPLYSRCLLTYLIAGSISEDKLYFKPKDFYKEKDIKTYLGEKAAAIYPAEKTVSLKSGVKLKYDKLLLATGASAKPENIPGADKPGVFTVRKLDDARAIIAMLDRVQSVVVLGGGLIGLRDAYALRLKGKQVTVVVKSPQILSQMVDKTAAEMIAGKLKRNGIQIITGAAARDVEGRDTVQSVMLDSGERLACQMVIVGKGVSANTELASASGLKVEAAIAADRFLRATDKDIYAAGDCAQTYDIARGEQRVNALWPCAVEQGEIAALNMLGKNVEYTGSLSMNSVDFFGLAGISIGITAPKDEAGYEIITQVRPEVYKKFVLKENKLAGAVFVGDIKAAGIAGVLIKQRVDVSSIKDRFTDENFNYAKIIPLVAEYKDKFPRQEYRDTLVNYR